MMTFPRSNYIVHSVQRRNFQTCPTFCIEYWIFMEIIVSNQIDEVQINVQHQKFVEGRKKADLTICLA